MKNYVKENSVIFFFFFFDGLTLLEKNSIRKYLNIRELIQVGLS